MSDLTWDELDELVDTDTIALRDRAWAEIERLRDHKRNLQDVVDATCRHMAAVHAVLDLSHEAETEAVVAKIEGLHERIRGLMRERDQLEWDGDELRDALRGAR